MQKESNHDRRMRVIMMPKESNHDERKRAIIDEKKRVIMMKERE